MPATLSYRWAAREDYRRLGEILFEAVRTGTSPYNEEQRQAWAPGPRTGSTWKERLSGQSIILAETKDDAVAFMSLMADGYVDFAYILPDFRGQGLFRRLYDKLESRALNLQLDKLTTHASLMAMPAFAAMGFEVIEPETVAVDGVELDRFQMRKTLK